MAVIENLVTTSVSARDVVRLDIEPLNSGPIPTIDDFTFIKPISRGAFGKVFLGHKNGNPERVYAIKVVKKSDMINKNLTNQVVAERDAMAKLVSPFVVQLYYSIQSQENIFLVMEYMIGGDVKSLLGVAGYFDESMAFMYTAEVTLALQYLHRKGIIHRDLKPDNLLITAKGHIKLTDFGLAKLNMNFSDSADVPMTPKTPMYNNKNMYDIYRTPGQILSLQSSFAFSSSKNSSLTSSIHSSASKVLVPQTPNTGTSTQHPTPDRSSAAMHSHSKLNKQKSMRDLLLSQSTSKYLSQSKEMHTPGRQNVTPVKPPVKRLMSTLQKSSILAALSSCNESRSDCDRRGSDRDSTSDKLSILSSFDASKSEYRSEEISGILPSTISAPSTVSTLDMSDDVFMSGASQSVSMGTNSIGISDIRTGDSHNSVDRDQKVCDCDRGTSRDCLECESHQKAPSRQEKLTDDTPQMHRTEESVWNSYAAKHLRSLRRDSYSEDSEDNDKENMPSSISESDVKRVNSPVLRFTYKVRAKCNPRRLTKTKSFCYPSDDESDGEERRYKERFRFARKRNFDDVEQSPVRRTHSADSGLTREISLLRFGEPQTKRSHSIPRTRIRFHSGQDREKPFVEKPIQSPLAGKFDTKNCLDNIVKETKILPDLDKISVLSADEKRLVEGHSDTSASEPDHISESDKSVSKDLIDSKISDKDKLLINHQTEKQQQQQRKESLDCDEPMVTGSSNIFRLVNKNLAHLQPRMVSSLNSDSMLENLGTNLSSICEKEGSNIDSNVSAMTDNSVFNSPPVEQENEGKKERKSSSEEKQASSVPILPPPPPKTRRPSGKKTPAKIRFASMATCISPYVYNETRSRNNSGWNDVCMTPDSATRLQGYHTPKPSYPATPKTPLQRALARSYSFSNVGQVIKTPFRTPKSVKRVPANQEPEEERILGTPDYLAPEILLQKPHGPSVDWWSLGVCLFEFLTGVPPFNDQTPEKVFENILNRDIPWPEDDEALSPNSREAIEALLTMDPEDRARARDIKKMAAFDHIDWENLCNLEAPWIPQPDDMTDTSYFEARNMMQDLFVSDVDFR